MTPLRVTPADVEWVDVYGAALVCGRQVTRADIARFTAPGDRRCDNKLTSAARERIADALTDQLRYRDRSSAQPPR